VVDRLEGRGRWGRMEESKGKWKVGVTTGERKGKGRKVGSSEGRKERKERRVVTRVSGKPFP